MIAWKLVFQETLILQVFFPKNNLKLAQILLDGSGLDGFWGKSPDPRWGIFFRAKNHRNPMSEGQPWEPPITTHRNSIEGQQLTAAALAAAPPPVGQLSWGELRQWNLGRWLLLWWKDDEHEKQVIKHEVDSVDMDLLGFVGWWTCFFLRTKKSSEVFNGEGHF